MGCYQNSLLLSINLLIINLLKDCVCVCVCVRARVCVCMRSVASNSFATLWAAAVQVPLSMGFPRQEYWSGLPFPSPGKSS